MFSSTFPPPQPLMSFSTSSSLNHSCLSLPFHLLYHSCLSHLVTKHSILLSCSGLPLVFCLPTAHAAALLLCDPALWLSSLQLLQLPTADQGLLRYAEHQLQAWGDCSMTHGEAAPQPHTVPQEPVSQSAQGRVLKDILAPGQSKQAHAGRCSLLVTVCQRFGSLLSAAHSFKRSIFYLYLVDSIINNTYNNRLS